MPCEVMCLHVPGSSTRKLWPRVCLYGRGQPAPVHLPASRACVRHVRLSALALASQYTENTRDNWTHLSSLWECWKIRNSQNGKLEGCFIIDSPTLSVYFLNCDLQDPPGPLSKSPHCHPGPISDCCLKAVKHAGTFLHKMMGNDSGVASTRCPVSLVPGMSSYHLPGNSRCPSKTFKELRLRGKRGPETTPMGPSRSCLGRNNTSRSLTEMHFTKEPME